MPLKTGEVAARSGVSADTIRHYEREGLLPRAARTRAGYRAFAESAVTRVQLVQNALRLGFTVKQLAEFLRARDRGTPPCRRVRDAGAQLLVTLDERIATLTAARDVVRSTVAAWDERLGSTAAESPARLLERLQLPDDIRPLSHFPRRRR